MGIVISLVLIAFGAILTWAVNTSGGSVDPQVVGVILMVVGAVSHTRGQHRGQHARLAGRIAG